MRIGNSVRALAAAGMKKSIGMKREASEGLLFELAGEETQNSSPAASASCAVPAGTRRKMMGTSAVEDEVTHGADDAVREAERRTVLDAVPAGVLLISPRGGSDLRIEVRAAFWLDFGSVGTIKEYKVLAGIVESRFGMRRRFRFAGERASTVRRTPPATNLKSASRRGVAGALFTAGGGSRGRHRMARNISRHHQPTAFSVRAAANGENGGGGATRFRDRAPMNNPLTAIMGYAQLLLAAG